MLENSAEAHTEQGRWLIGERGLRAILRALLA